jgi:hypothetical protein
MSCRPDGLPVRLALSDFLADEAGAGRLVFVLVLIAAGAAAVFFIPQLGVIGFLRDIGQRLAAGAFW